MIARLFFLRYARLVFLSVDPRTESPTSGPWVRDWIIWSQRR